jgi:hypothetical protein
MIKSDAWVESMQFSIIAVNLKTKKAKADPNDEGIGEGKMSGLRCESCLFKFRSIKQV